MPRRRCHFDRPTVRRRRAHLGRSYVQPPCQGVCCATTPSWRPAARAAALVEDRLITGLRHAHSHTGRHSSLADCSRSPLWSGRGAPKASGAPGGVTSTADGRLITIIQRSSSPKTVTSPAAHLARSHPPLRTGPSASPHTLLG